MSADARISMLDVDASRAAAAAAGVSAAVADLSVFRVWLRHPDVARWLADLIMGLLRDGRLGHRLRELIIMRTGWITGSDYEWTQHWRIATLLGIDESDLLGVRDWEHHDFGPAERAVLAATDETVATGTIGAATWAACVEHVGPEPEALIEMVTAIGVWRMLSGILRSLDVPLEAGTASWPPDGTAPGPALSPDPKERP